MIVRRITVLATAGVVLVAGLGAAGPTAWAQGSDRGGDKKEAKKEIEFSDEAVAEAIRKGVEFLRGKQESDGSWGPFGKKDSGHYYPVGPSAMVTYALLESGLCRYNDPDLKRALDFLDKWQAPDKLLAFTPPKVDDAYKKNWQSYCHMTYSLGLRANAYLAAAKQGAREYRMRLRKDAVQLMRATKDGSYNYTSYGQMDSGGGDNSNSQYGVLGVWAAAQLDEEVPRQYWYVILKHWLECVNNDGGWAYRADRAASTATMTTAGLATLFVCYDNLLADGFVKCDQGPKVQQVLQPLTRALDWMDKHFTAALGGQALGYGDLHYLLYGVERVGLASGYKYFGKADWYKLGAKRLLNSQAANGSWSGGRGEIVSTSFALLFLVRGRHAVLFNKLEFDGDWNNRPRDLAGLTRWTSSSFETTVNWQIINLLVPPEEWHDAPILYISGSTAPKFTNQQIDALRTYVHQGGTILSCTECDGQGFSKGIREVYAKLFPNYPLTACPKDHLLYDINFKLAGFPDFQVISNGVRPLVVHTDKDLAKAWQLRLEQTDKESFQAAANVAMYATGKALADKALAARGSTLWPEEVKFEPARAVKVARLQYRNREGKPGNFDPEPLAWQRFSRLMAQANQTKVDVAGPIPISDLATAGAQVGVLAGTDAAALSDEEIAALRKFLTDGGMLVLEAVGGAWPNGGAQAFDESAEVITRQIADGLGDDVVLQKRLRRLTLTSPLYAQAGFEIKDVGFRRFSRVDVGIQERLPQLKAVLDAKGNPLIIASTEDLTAGLAGCEHHEIHGYTPASAFEIMRNIVLFKAKELPKPAPKKDDKPAGK